MSTANRLTTRFVTKTLISVQNTLKEQDPSKTQNSSDIERQVMEITDIKRLTTSSQPDILPTPKTKNKSSDNEDNDKNDENDDNDEKPKSDNDEDKADSTDEVKPKIKDKPKKSTPSKQPKAEPKGRGRGRGKKQKQGYASLEVMGGKHAPVSSDDDVVIIPKKDIKDDADDPKKRKRDIATVLKDPIPSKKTKITIDDDEDDKKPNTDTATQNIELRPVNWGKRKK